MADVTYAVEVDPRDIDDVLNDAAESEETGRTRWPGSTFEQGVAAGIKWVLGLPDGEHPFEG